MGNQKLSQSSRAQRRLAERAELLGKPSDSKRDPSSAVDEEWHTLNAQIGALESFIHGATRRVEAQRRRKLENILPPPDRSDFPRDRGHQRMSRWQQRHHQEVRARHGLTFFLLFLAVCAVLWWLLDGGQW